MRSSEALVGLVALCISLLHSSQLLPAVFHGLRLRVSGFIVRDDLLVNVADLVASFQQAIFCGLNACPHPAPSHREYDVIIIGGGSAGSVLAARLSEDHSVSVLLLESGPTDQHPLVDIPLGSQFLQGTTRDWQSETNPQAKACRQIQCSPLGRFNGSKGECESAGRRLETGDRRGRANSKLMGYRLLAGCCKWPLGRGLGGGSSINYMAYVRGNKNDYAAWEARGAKGWNYTTALKYFKKAENNHMFRFSSFHGSQGPLHVSDPHLRNPVTAGQCGHAPRQKEKRIDVRARTNRWTDGQTDIHGQTTSRRVRRRRRAQNPRICALCPYVMIARVCVCARARVCTRGWRVCVRARLSVFEHAGVCESHTRPSVSAYVFMFHVCCPYTYWSVLRYRPCFQDQQHW